MSSLANLASYMPQLVVRRMRDNPAPIEAPTFERYLGAALYTDFTGFTRLTERLEKAARTQQGAGPEELASVVNAYFEQIIDIIQTHGGDVMKFTGDGVLALWPLEPGDKTTGNEETDLARLTRLAAQCGLALQQALHNYVTKDGSRLAMRIGVGAGEVFVVHLGGVFKRWEFLVAGELILQASTAEGQAQPGQVILSPEAFDRIRAFCQAAPVEENGKPTPAASRGYLLESTPQPLTPPAPAPLTLAASVEAALRPYIPAAIISRLDAGHRAWLAELRRLTVLFINLPDFDHTGPNALEKAQTVMRTLQESIYRFEGSINKLNIDDKGVTLVAALGLPPLAHEDDPERGAQAALKAAEEMHKLGIRCAIGVATGLSFCGVIGSSDRREYTMMGATVNLAARLMQAAPNPSARPWRTDDAAAEPPLPVPRHLAQTLLCDENTCQAAQAHVVFEPLPPIQVKGKSEPVPIYRPIRLKKSREIAPEKGRPANRLIGRKRERFILAQELQGLQRGSTGRAIVIEGEAGIGKSRLVEELVAQAEATGIQVLIGAGDSIERSKPYHAWRAVFRKLFDFGDTGSTQNRLIPSLVRLMTDPEVATLAPLLNEVLDIGLPDNQVTQDMAGQVRADNTRGLLVRMLQTACKRTSTSIILEDAHWMDSASWALLKTVHAQVQPVLLVLVTRPPTTPVQPEYTHILTSPETAHILLEPLPAEDTIDLVCQRLGVAELPAAVAELIQTRAEGHPFYSEELAYALRDTGLLHLEEGQATLAPGFENLATLPFPDTVQGVITSRIDRLAPPQQLTLKIASVIGRVFSYPLLYDVHPIPEDKEHLKSSLQILQNLDITPLETPEPDLAYIFKHIITQEVSYNLMSFAQRQQLHREVAAWYETHHAEDLQPLYPLLAYHWSKASVPEKAVAYFEKAGQEALRSGAYQEAIRFLQHASQWDAQLPPSKNEPALPISWTKHITPGQFRRARWQRMLCRANLGLGQLSVSHQHAETALSLLEYPLELAPRKLPLHLAYQLTRQLFHRLLPASGAPPVAEIQAVMLERARVFASLAEIYFFTNETLPMAYAAVNTLNMAEEAGPGPELAEAYANMGFLMGVIPIHRFARGYLRKAQQASQATQRGPTQAYVSLITALYSVSVGDWEQTQAAASEACRIYKQFGDQRRWGEALSIQALTRHFLADFEESRQSYQSLYDAGRRTGDVQHQTWGLDGQAINLIRLGQSEEAEAILLRSLPLFERSNDRAEEFIHRGSLAAACFYHNKPAEALAAARQAVSLGKEFSAVYSTLEGYASVAEVLLGLWEASPGEKQLAQEATASVKAFNSYARRFPIGLPRAGVWEGLRLWLSRHPAAAFKAWEEALELAQSMQMPYEIALAHLQIGRHLPPAHPQAVPHLRAAGALFERLGCAGEKARAEKPLKDLAEPRS